MTQSVFKPAYFAAHNTEQIQKFRTFKKSIEKMLTKITNNNTYFSTKKKYLSAHLHKISVCFFLSSQCYLRKLL